MEHEHKKWPKMPHLDKVYCDISQKLDGTNAQVLITDGKVMAGSRTRWLTTDHDNYGFCAFVEDHAQELIACLGEGRHYGEWCGPGIQNGEGLAQRTFFVFEYYPREGCIPVTDWPVWLKVVPGICSGPLSKAGELIEWAITHLKAQGSRLVPGHTPVEGIVINVAGQRFKYVFEAEDKPLKVKSNSTHSQEVVGVAHLLQPIRLSKLLGRDEEYLREYPSSLRKLVTDYIKDLEEEGQFSEVAYEKRAQKKALGKHVYKFIQEQVTIKNNSYSSPVTPDNAGG